MVRPRQPADCWIFRLRAGRCVNSAGSVLNFNGGLLQIQGTGITGLESHPINLNAAGSGIDVSHPSNAVTLNNPYAFNNSFIKAGAGTLVLAGANTYTGATSVSAGILYVANSNALGSTNGTTDISVGGKIQNARGARSSRPFVEEGRLTPETAFCASDDTDAIAHALLSGDMQEGGHGEAGYRKAWGKGGIRLKWGERRV